MTLGTENRIILYKYKGSGKMKNQYIIMRHINLDIVEREKCACILFYNAHSKNWITMQNYATIYTNKRKAMNDLKWADKYASGCELLGKSEVFKLGIVEVPNTYYLYDNGKCIASSYKLERLLNKTTTTNDAHIFYNGHLVWVQNPKR